MRAKKHKSGFHLVGYILFLLPLSVVVAAALVIYDGLLKANFGGGITAFFMLLYLLFATLIFVLTDVFRRRIMIDAPVNRILSATERIAKGDFSVRLTLEHGYEKYDYFDAIIENINKVANELGKSEILKSEFISNVSHEIKTPLSVIKNYVKALDNPTVDDKTRKKYIEVLTVTTEKLSDLVTNILKLNKLENQALSVDKTVISLGEVLRESILQYEDLIESKNIELDLDISDFEVVTKQSYAEIIFNNLINNAIKFSNNGGKIEIKLKRGIEKAVFTVKDYGIGMSKETGAHVFEKFYQGDTSHRSEGNGLGLALVKKVIDVLGGEVSVKSKLGEGSEFSVVFKGVING